MNIYVSKVKQLICVVVLTLLSHAVMYAEEFWYGERQETTLQAEALTYELMSSADTVRSFGSLGNNFLAFNANEINGNPPDLAGAVGTTQYVGIINGWIRSFNKTMGKADNIINTSLINFFGPIVNGAADLFDVRLLFDRLSNKWFLLSEDRNADYNGEINNIYIALSDSDKITLFTKWRYFKFPIGKKNGTQVFFADYPTFGIDVNALYVGVHLFPESRGAPDGGARVLVIPKAPMLACSQPTCGVVPFFTFDNLTNFSGDGAGNPQGVTNFDPTATTGYFIGTNGFSSALVVYRVSNPGTTPTISSPIFVTNGFTQLTPPIRVPTKNGSMIDGGDTRLLCAHIRNNQLWTVCCSGCDNTGNVDTNNPTRVASCWFQLDITPPVPTILQSGVLFDSTGAQNSFIFPSVMSSGQINMVLGCSAAGPNAFINAAIACRASTDAPGTLRPPTLFTNSMTAYRNEDSDRWGDYNLTSLDPCDDMTMWTIQQYSLMQPPRNEGSTIWGCQVVQVKAPPPATPTSATSVSSGQVSVTTTVTGISVNGSGFYDPGTGFGCRIAAQVTGPRPITVNSVTYINPTQVQLTLNTMGATPGFYTVTIINPDGQKAIGVGILRVT